MEDILVQIFNFKTGEGRCRHFDLQGGAEQILRFLFAELGQVQVEGGGPPSVVGLHQALLSSGYLRLTSSGKLKTAIVKTNEYHEPLFT